MPDLLGLKKLKNRLRPKSPAGTASISSSQPALQGVTGITQTVPGSAHKISRSTLPSTNAILPLPTTPSRPDLWKEAESRLPSNKQELLQELLKLSPGFHKSGHDIAEQLRGLAEKRRGECEQQQWKFKFREKEIILRDVADKIVIWLVKFREIGDIVVNYDPVHLALPWAGIRFLLQCAVQDSQQMGTMLLGLEKITYLINRSEVCEEFYLRRPVPDQALENLEKSLIDLYHIILDFLTEVFHLYRQNLAKKVVSTVFNPERLENILQKFTQAESSVKHAADDCEKVYSRGRDIELNESARRLHKILQDLEEPIRRTDSRVATLLTALQDSERSAILCWISAVPYEDNHKNAKSGRAASTGQWLLHHDTYLSWRKSSSSTILWLHGIPGAGKTKLTTHVVDNLIEDLRGQSNDEGFAYFFCDRNDRDRQDPLCVMQSLVKQLATSRTGDTLQSSIVNLYRRKKKSGFASSQLDWKECQELFDQYVNVYPQTTIVLDALDECNSRTRSSLIKVLDESIVRAQRPTKIFISSRRDDDIRRRFEGGPNVSISATDNIEDIRTFVKQRLDEADGDRDMAISPQFREEIIATLSGKSQGMCQWANLQLDQLLEIDLEDDMRIRLSRLPGDLKKAYDEIYREITRSGGRTTALAVRAFLWVMQTYIPLSPTQLVAAICQDPELDMVKGVDINISFVLKACKNLLVIDHELQVCRFSHLSVQEYLEDHHLTPMEAHGIISKVSLQLLMHGRHPVDQACELLERIDYAVQHGFKPFTDELDGQYRSYVLEQCLSWYDHGQLNNLLVYVIPYWSRHVKYCESLEIDPRLAHLLRQFLGSPSNGTREYIRWCRSLRACEHKYVWRYTPCAGSYLYPTTLPVLAMCCLGLFRILEQWWTSGLIDPSLRNALNLPLLTLAAKYGQLEICKWLICHGADVDAHNEHDYTALIAASAEGHLDIVQLLLDQGADVGTSGRSPQTPLAAASWRGHVDAVQLLLDRGADVNAVVENLGTALTTASESNHPNVVQLLLDRGADINAVGDGHDTALVYASLMGCTDISRLLLDRGADASIVSKRTDNGTALITASQMAYIDIVRLLLDGGADVNARCDHAGYETALIAASTRGCLDIVRLLLDRGADANIVSSQANNRTALIDASGMGHIDTVRLLLDRGADVNIMSKDVENRTALIAASKAGHIDTVRLLLDRGADVAGNDKYLGKALDCAESWGRLDIARLLRDHGATTFVKTEDEEKLASCDG